MAVISLLFATRAGLAWLDIVDNWTNVFNLILIGVIECIFVGWVFKPKKVLDEVNKNTKKFHLPGCSSVNDIKASNRWDFSGTREEVISKGYIPCKRCYP
jgi:hypothetical protein